MIPLLGRRMGLADAAAGAFITLSGVLWAATSPLWGPLSQAKGRKPFILLGLGSFVLSTAALALVAALGLAGALTGAWLFLALTASRAIYGGLGSAGPPAAQAYVADRTDLAERTVAVSRLTAAFVAGTVAGPLVMNAATPFGWWGPFLSIGVIGVISAVGVTFLLPERTPPRTDRVKPRSIPPWRPDIRGSSITGLCIAAALAVNYATIGFHMLDRTGLGQDRAESLVRYAWSAAAVAALIGQLIIIPRIRRPALDLLLLGAALMAGGQVLLLTAPGGVSGLMAGFALAGFGYAFARPGFIAAATVVVKPDEQGAAAGAAAAVSGVAFAAGPLFGSALYGVVWWGPLATNLALLGIALGVGAFDPGLRSSRRIERQGAATAADTDS